MSKITLHNNEGSKLGCRHRSDSRITQGPERGQRIITRTAVRSKLFFTNYSSYSNAPMIRIVAPQINEASACTLANPTSFQNVQL